MFRKDDIRDLVEAAGHIRASNGHRVGRLSGAVAVDAQGNPAWVGVRTGLLRAFHAFVPLEGARIEGEEILVPHTREQIMSAPPVAEDGHLMPDEEQKLRTHYGISS